MDIEQSSILLTGLLLLLGLLAGQLANRVGIPRVVAYVATGTLFSPEQLGHFFHSEINQWMEPLTHISLGIIAFVIGGSISWTQLKRIGRSILGIALGESIGAVLIVLLALLLFSPQLDGIPAHIVAMGFAAMAATTAPAATIAVLHQYRAKGIFSTTLLGVVALDDALGIIFFSVALALFSDGSIGINIEIALLEIILALFVGLIAGFVVAKLSNHIRPKALLLPLTLGSILLITGLSEAIHLSPLLASMAMGFSSRLFLYSAGDKLFGSIDFLEETVFLLFFTLAGTHFNIHVFLFHLDLIFVYFFARIVGKMLGSAIGAKLTRSPIQITRWIGLALIPQAGIAVGLALTLSHQPQFKEIGLIIVNVILATTLLYELIGPLATRFALKQAGEITDQQEDDLIQ